MSDFSFSVNDVLSQQFKQVFGLELPKVYQKTHTNTDTPLYGTDQFGRTYFLPVIIDGYELPHPSMSVRVRKHVVETEMTERHGSVKEIINTGDYEFIIRGFCIGNNEWPEATIRELADLYSKKSSLSMQSALSDIFLFDRERNGYDKVVIMELEFPEYKGVEFVKPYAMHLKSDSPFNLVEK